MSLTDLQNHLNDLFCGQHISCVVVYDELIVTTPPEHIRELLLYLRDHPQCRFAQLVDLCGVDYPSRPKRFEVVYNLLSLMHNRRIRVKTAVADGDAVPSVVDVYSCAGWFEREAWDLYGIRFDGNPDLRRILTDYGFEGHPLRKDFPLTGYVEVRYNSERQQVVYEPVQLTQDYRNFDYVSPWEGMLNHPPQPPKVSDASKDAD